jgi:hypothetical protein
MNIKKILLIWLLTIVWISSVSSNTVKWEDLMCPQVFTKEAIETTYSSSIWRKEWTTIWEKIAMWTIWFSTLWMLCFSNKLEEFTDWEIKKDKKKKK